MGKVVVTTGCSSGFGRQLAQRLARLGDRVFATRCHAATRNAAVAPFDAAVLDAFGLTD